VDDIIEAIGIDSLETLTAAFGYVQMYIPKDPRAATKIIALIGPEKYHLLASVAGGCTVSLPRGQREFLKLRNKEILSDRKSGLDMTDLSFKYRLTERQIRAILKNQTINEVFNERFNKDRTENS